MRWILVEIWSRDSKFRFVRIDPLPQAFARRASLCPCLALHANEIGCKPMAIAAAAAAAVVRAVRRSLIAGCELLPVIIAETARYAGRKAGVVHRPERTIQFPFEPLIHASDHIVLQR